MTTELLWNIQTCIYKICIYIQLYNYNNNDHNYYKHSNIHVYNSTYLCTSVAVQILMSVVMEHTIALIYVLTLMEATCVDVMMVII